MEFMGAFCTLIVGLLMSRYGWLCLKHRQWINSKAYWFWISEKGWKLINTLGIAFLLLLSTFGFFCLVSSNRQGAVIFGMIILFGLIGIASQRIARPLSISLYESMSKNPTVPGIFSLVLGLAFILVALAEFLKAFRNP